MYIRSVTVAALVCVANAQALSLPKFSLPKVTLPKISLPQVSMPKVSIPKVTLPKLSMPTFSMPKVSLPQVSMPKVTLPKMSLPSDEAICAAVESAAAATTAAAKQVAAVGARYASQAGAFVAPMAHKALEKLHAVGTYASNHKVALCGIALASAITCNAADKGWNRWLDTTVEYHDWCEFRQCYMRWNVTRRTHKLYTGSYFNIKKA